MNSKTGWALLASSVLLFAWGVIRLYDLRLTVGDIYPVYSSYRSDPLGSKVLYESLSRLPGYTVTRSFKPLDQLRPTNATLLWLGEDPFSFVLTSDEELQLIENAAAQGLRIVFAMTPVKKPSAPDQMQVKASPLEKRWGVSFVYVRSLQESNQGHTSLVMKSGGVAMAVIEKRFGKGAVVLVDSAFPFSNQALAAERNTALMDQLLDANPVVIFDEHHLGLTEEASVAMLARKYRLTGLVAGLLILALLFIWRNSTSLLPPKTVASANVVALGRDSAAGLEHLLRRNIPESEVVAVCLAEWEKSGETQRGISEEKRSIIKQIAASNSGSKPLEVYRKLQAIINHRD